MNEFLRGKDYRWIIARYASAARDLPSVPNLIVDVDDEYPEVMASKIQAAKSSWKKLRLTQIYFFNVFYYRSILAKSKMRVFVKFNNRSDSYVLPNIPFQSVMLFEKDGVYNPDSKKLLYIGKLSYSPNTMGIVWFLKNVWPKLLQFDSVLSLTIVSSTYPESELEQIIQKVGNVNLMINPSEVESLYGKHKLVVNPVFSGGGSNIKVSEALWNRRKVISSEFGIRGFEKWREKGIILVPEATSQWPEIIRKQLCSDSSSDSEDFDLFRAENSWEAWEEKLKRILDVY
ncbi:glycosyltransferase family 4 protein [Negadavirga shengliensis]|uniref:Glycosyltransferase family 4 protein n=1 Tax=Negadavirga shengliensis TaxID=1389218 RepID=A0ABV9T4Z4_9BACT